MAKRSKLKPLRKQNVSPPVAVDPCYQRDVADCGLAALAMVLGVGYERVSTEAVLGGGNLCRVHKHGVYMSDLIKLAARFDVALVRVPVERVDDGACGILGLDHKKLPMGHSVAVFRRIILNPADGMVWDYDVFVEKWVPRYLLIREDDEG